MAKITTSDRKGRAEVRVQTKPKDQNDPKGHTWWKARSKAEMAQQLLETAAFLKEQQQYRFRQAGIHARLYGNLPLASWAGASLAKVSNPNALPVDRPTFNVVQSCVDTLVSRLGQSKPRPVFLTDNGNYKNRTLAKQMNSFINGEMYNAGAHDLAKEILRDAAIIGTGCIKILRTIDNKVGLERTLATELFVDTNDAFYGNPRTLYQFKLVDRSVLAEQVPEYRSEVAKAEHAVPDSSGESNRGMADQVMIVEAWHLPSGPEAGDGKHIIACTAGLLLDEEWKHDYFPFAFMHYSKRLVGFWAQGLTEQLTGTQLEINKLLSTISQSINLVGVPRVFVEDGSKVVKSHLNNNIGSIVTYRGTKPEYEVAPSVHPELYAQLQRLIDYAYQQSGISALAAASQKPKGLNSGEAIRNYDDLQSDRFADLEQRWHNLFIDLSYKMIDQAVEIAEETGSYSTIYPDKDGTREINLPDIKKLKENPYVLQCFDTSSLPRDPAGRQQSIIDLMQAGIITPEDGQRLLNFPDLDAQSKLRFAATERIQKQLDDIVETGKYSPPDTFTDIIRAKELVTQYYNLYECSGLEESKAEKLRLWQTQVLELEAQAQAALMPMGAVPQPGVPQAAPEAPPTNPMVPNVPRQ